MQNSKVKIDMNAEETFEFEDESKPYNIRHRCYYFSKDVIIFVRNSHFDRVYYSMFDQLIRSATSIGANLVEGKSGSTKRDWKNYCTIALKSANETKYWLCLIRDTIEVDKIKIKDLINEAEEISNIVAKILINAEKD